MKNNIKGNYNNVLQANNITFKLSDHEDMIPNEYASKILKETIESSQNQTIMYTQNIGGSKSIKCGNSQLSINNAYLSKREMATYEATLDKMIKYGYIKQVSNQKVYKAYEITEKGYEYYDSNIAKPDVNN